MEKRILILILLIFCSSCPNTAKEDSLSVEVPIETSEEAATLHTTFPSYWGRGLAELNRYELKKGRYNDQHDGEVVFVFVTEDFNTKTQVKYDSGDRQDVQKVLKLNAYERFYTGVYPYTILSSIFSPTNPDLAFPEPYKMMSNVQEWCGASWLQVNQNDEGYKARGFSYFQSEGDEEFQISNTHFEDSIWNAIRINPASLPIGKTQMVPPLTYARLMHIKLKAYNVEASLEINQSSEFSGKKISIYTLNYPELKRQFTFHFETEFPHRIFGFKEKKITYSGSELETSARLTKSIMLDYWNKNNKSDAPYRKALGLQF